MFLVGLALLPVQAVAERAASLPIVQIGSQAVKLDRWLAMGPFSSSTKKYAAEDSFLRHVLGDEPAKSASLAPGEAVAAMTAWLQNADNTAPSDVADATASGRKTMRMRLTGGRDLINLPYALGLDVPEIKETNEPSEPSTHATEGFYYAACVIRSAKPATVYLMFGCDSPFRLSLNGVQVAAEAKSRVLRLWDFSYPLQLAGGDNLLLLRIDDRAGGAGIFAARSEPTKEAASFTALQDSDALTLSATLITAGQSLSIRVRGAPSADLLPAQIVSFDDAPVAEAGLVGNPPVTWGSTGVAPGLYKVRIRYEGATFERPFYIMKRGARLQDLMSGLDWSHLPVNEEQKIDLQTLRRRMDVLCRPEHWLPADREWQRKIGFTLGEIKSITDKIKEGREPIKGVPGMHLRGFVSAIDGQTEYYRLFVPSGYRTGQTGGLPIILIMPTNTVNPRPFIESVFIAHQIEADTLAALAEKKGCALLWVGFRCLPRGSPCEFTHFDEVLHAVEQDYRIDERRIYLMGECGGAALALMYNVRYPGRFAATALINARFHSYEIADGADAIFSSLPEYQRWSEANDPVTPTFQSVRPSLLVLHDGIAEEGHGELRYTLEFAAQAKAAGFQFIFHQLPPSLHYHLESWSNMLDWLLPQHVDAEHKAQSVPALSRFGPIARAFAGPFILVEGTGGTARDQLGMHSLSQSFQDTWKKVHGGPCRVTDDRALPDSDKAAYNLILLGNPATNRIWRDIEGQVPPKIASDGISIGARNWSGPSLSVQALLPNPYNPAKLAVVIGAGDLAAARFGTMNLSIRGWYDFAIWRARAETGELVAAADYADIANSKVAGVPIEKERPRPGHSHFTGW
jgi:pimeloyl-ACP methyl ester carboxylesterase